MEVKYFVKAKSPQSARRVGLVYLSQLCDLLSVVTQSPVMFCEDSSDSREEQIRQRRLGVRVDRTLTLEEWSWVTGTSIPRPMPTGRASCAARPTARPRDQTDQPHHAARRLPLLRVLNGLFVQELQQPLLVFAPEQPVLVADQLGLGHQYRTTLPPTTWIFWYGVSPPFR